MFSAKKADRYVWGCLLALLLAPHGYAQTLAARESTIPAQPSVQEAQAAILMAIRANTKVSAEKKAEIEKNMKVEAVQACFPAAGKTADMRVCVIDSIHAGTHQKQRDSMSMRYSAGKWSLVMNAEQEPADFYAACPSSKEAQALLRALGKLTTLELEENDDPSGVFSEERGLTRNKKGPYRLMCIYTGHQKRTSTEWTLLTYIWMKDGKYVMDADFEALPD